MLVPGLVGLTAVALAPGSDVEPVLAAAAVPLGSAVVELWLELVDSALAVLPGTLLDDEPAVGWLPDGWVLTWAWGSLTGCEPSGPAA